MNQRPPYGDRRPYALPESLADLAGPTEGLVLLPRTVAWTGRREYDISSTADVRVLYERVLTEAPDAGVLSAVLDTELLRRVWSEMVLPVSVRRLWEARFNELSSAAQLPRDEPLP